MNWTLHEILEAISVPQRSQWFWLETILHDPRKGLVAIGNGRHAGLYHSMQQIARNPETKELGWQKWHILAGYEIRGWQLFEMKIRLKGQASQRFYVYRNLAPKERDDASLSKHIVVYVADKTDDNKAEKDYLEAQSIMQAWLDAQ